MKLFFIARLWIIAACCFLLSCRLHHHGNIDITLSESDRFYTMDAYFAKRNTYKVQQYMDNRIGKDNNTSFTNATIDGDITLDDKTNFYIKLKDGELKIKLNKKNNSYASYQEIKLMCEGLKNEIESQ